LIAAKEKERTGQKRKGGGEGKGKTLLLSSHPISAEGKSKNQPLGKKGEEIPTPNRAVRKHRKKKKERKELHSLLLHFFRGGGGKEIRRKGPAERKKKGKEKCFQNYPLNFKDDAERGGRKGHPGIPFSIPDTKKRRDQKEKEKRRKKKKKRKKGGKKILHSWEGGEVERPKRGKKEKTRNYHYLN